MSNLKNIIAKAISKASNINEKELEEFIEIPKDTSMGDYAFPCFKLAKELKKAPPAIANDIKEKLEIEEKYIKKVEIVGGYLNFYINNNILVEEVLKEFEIKKENYGTSKVGEGKNIVIDH